MTSPIERIEAAAGTDHPEWARLLAMPDSPAVIQAAVRHVVRTQRGSSSDIQRRARVGFTTAQILMDMLTARGVLGPRTGDTPRGVLYRPDQIDQALDAVGVPLRG